jgi:chloramphenicol 3-O-phosphotransferase
MNAPADKPLLVMLHGPAACGKLTIARELASLTGFGLFHNHLTVDLLLALFPFGSPEFIQHRERIWLDLISDAVRAGRSVIFTFHPERTVRPDFPATLRNQVTEAGGRAAFVEIRCSKEAIRQRIDAESRRTMHKLVSAEFCERLEREGAFDFPPISSEFAVDSTINTPSQSAKAIVSALGLPTVINAAG